MAVIDDDSVAAYAAARELRALYAAYRATSRAHVLVLRRMAAGLEADATTAREERERARQEIVRRTARARETEVVFGIRADQLRRRLLELRGLPVRR